MLVVGLVIYVTDTLRVSTRGLVQTVNNKVHSHATNKRRLRTQMADTAPAVPPTDDKAHYETLKKELLQALPKKRAIDKQLVRFIS